MYPTSIFQSAELSIDDKNKLNMVINHLLFLMRIKSVSLYEHSQRVSNLAAATAIYMRLTANEITLIRNAGLLHDIGLICVPNHVLTNYPYVSKRDIQVYKRHPDLGANILESCPGMEDLIPLIRFHHERWDGTGYPKHLKKINIPLGARIIALASYYDDVIFSSPNFKHKDRPEVSRAIFSGSGILFDPDVVSAPHKIRLQFDIYISSCRRIFHLSFFEPWMVCTFEPPPPFTPGAYRAPYDISMMFFIQSRNIRCWFKSFIFLSFQKISQQFPEKIHCLQ